MGPKLLLARSTLPDDALAEDCADDAAGALVTVVVCSLEPPLPHAAIAIALTATEVATAILARRLLRIVTPSIGCAVCEDSATPRMRLVKRRCARAVGQQLCSPPPPQPALFSRAGPLKSPKQSVDRHRHDPYYRPAADNA